MRLRFRVMRTVSAPRQKCGMRCGDEEWMRGSRRGLFELLHQQVLLIHHGFADAGFAGDESTRHFFIFDAGLTRGE